MSNTIIEEKLKFLNPTKIKITGGVEITDYCSVCPNRDECGDFSFINIMYSRVPSILALAQLSLGKLKSLNLSEEEYQRLINYNVRYISFLEEMYVRYRKSLISVQYSQFNFKIETCILIDEMFHLYLKWFEKLLFWNRVNSIKAKPCFFYLELLDEAIDFIFSLFEKSIIEYNNNARTIIDIKQIKEIFKSRVIEISPPRTNGDYFTHTEIIKDNLSLMLETLLFCFLSIDRTQQEGIPFIYVSSSMFVFDEKTAIDIIRKIIKSVDSKIVKVKAVTKNGLVKHDLLMKAKIVIEDEGKEMVVI